MNTHYFIGIPAQQTIHEQVHRYWDKLQLANHYKVLPALTDLHITLLFIGSIPEHRLHTLQQQLTQIAKHHKPFTLLINGISYFGSPSGPRVVYLATSPNEELNYLQNAIAESGLDIGIQSSSHFSPHITIAKKRKSTDPIIIPKETFDSIPLQVKHFSLFSIHPSQTPKYTEVQRYEL